MKAKSRIKINKGKLISRLAMLCALFVVSSMLVSFVKYPEQYVTTWKYQLENKLSNGNQDAVEYYNENYVAKGKRLFGDEYIIKSEYLDMTTVVGYETSEDGVLLITNDGNGYFIEK